MVPKTHIYPLFYTPYWVLITAICAPVIVAGFLDNGDGAKCNRRGMHASMERSQDHLSKITTPRQY